MLILCFTVHIRIYLIERVSVDKLCGTPYYINAIQFMLSYKKLITGNLFFNLDLNLIGHKTFCDFFKIEQFAVANNFDIIFKIDSMKNL